PTFTPKSSYVAYNWDKTYIGVPFLNIWTGKAPMNPIYSGSDGINPIFDAALHPQPDTISQNAWKTILSITNVRYVSLHRDSDWNYILQKETTVNDAKIEEFVSKSPFLEKYRTFGEIELYEVSPEIFLPLIYPAATPILANGSLSDVLSSDDIVISSNVLFLSDRMNEFQWQFLEKCAETKNDNPPIITFQKLNPAKYKIEVENASDPFFLVFLESYHPGWKVYVDDRPFEFEEIIAEYDNTGVKESRHSMRFTPLDIRYLHEEQITDNLHFNANGYANAWYIDPKELGTTGNFTLTLYFKPQSYLYIGYLVSGITFILCIMYYIISRIKLRSN
ncbi:MAG: hypothetical protein SCH66_04580, partial [Methanolobus sp.]|nr:hypothetical protein [Methanolobus sp.]